MQLKEIKAVMVYWSLEIKFCPTPSKTHAGYFYFRLEQTQDLENSLERKYSIVYKLKIQIMTVDE